MSKNYYPVSEIDEKLKEYKKNNPRNKAQQAELDKYERIHRQRDQVEEWSDAIR